MESRKGRKPGQRAGSKPTKANPEFKGKRDGKTRVLDASKGTSARPTGGRSRSTGAGKGAGSDAKKFDSNTSFRANSPSKGAGNAGKTFTSRSGESNYEPKKWPSAGKGEYVERKEPRGTENRAKASERYTERNRSRTEGSNETGYNKSLDKRGLETHREKTTFSESMPEKRGVGRPRKDSIGEGKDRPFKTNESKSSQRLSGKSNRIPKQDREEKGTEKNREESTSNRFASGGYNAYKKAGENRPNKGLISDDETFKQRNDRFKDEFFQLNKEDQEGTFLGKDHPTKKTFIKKEKEPFDSAYSRRQRAAERDATASEVGATGPKKPLRHIKPGLKEGAPIPREYDPTISTTKGRGKPIIKDKDSKLSFGKESRTTTGNRTGGFKSSEKQFTGKSFEGKQFGGKPTTPRLNLEPIGPLKYFVAYKPFDMLCQFSVEKPDDQTLKDLHDFNKDVYPFGRLDKDSEGLIVLSNNRKINSRILGADSRIEKTYLVQVEGEITDEALNRMRKGNLPLSGGMVAGPCKAEHSIQPEWIAERPVPIRKRENIPTSWCTITIKEGKNRQIRRMTASIEFPTLRLIRIGFGKLSLEGMKPGQVIDVPEKDFMIKVGLNL